MGPGATDSVGVVAVDDADEARSVVDKVDEARSVVDKVDEAMSVVDDATELSTGAKSTESVLMFYYPSIGRQ